MKTPNLLLLILAIVTMSFNRLDSTLTEAERKHAIAILQESEENLLAKIKGLTPEQLSFKADAESWSVAECVEHIAISENNLFGFAQMGLKEAADPSKRSEVMMTDEAIVKMITDRSQKVKTSETFKPSGKFGSFDETVKEFKTKRANSISFIKTTADDLRNHYNDFPFGKLDTYQTILFMAAHSKRHTAQTEEVLGNANFPKKAK